MMVLATRLSRRTTLAAAAFLPLVFAVSPDVANALPLRVDPLRTAIAAPSRTPANVTRDRYRHPYEALHFFGVRPTDRVVEVYPGGGWYTEILAPYLSRGGSLALAGPESQLSRARKLVASNRSVYANVTFAPFESWSDKTGLPNGNADVVLTFRNVHNWQMQGHAKAAFRALYRMLKPGGVLGLVEHRLPERRPDSDMEKSGYMKTSKVTALARAAGFRLAAASEINANPKDKADYPDGVWTLPPSLRLGDKDRARYLAIGESDRMTLKFVKPR